MTRVAIPLLVLTFACGADRVDDSAETPPAIARMFTVHLGPLKKAVRVILGDATRFNTVATTSGEVVFTAPALQGPQRVTLVTEDSVARVELVTLEQLAMADSCRSRVSS